MESYRRVSSAS